MRRGATLVEVLISTAIFSFVIVAIFLTFNLGTRYWQASRAQRTLQDSIRYATDDIYKEVKRSSLSLIRFIDVKYDSGLLESPLSRDVLIVFSLDNWYDSNNYDDSGNPLWNRIVVYWSSPVLGGNSPNYTPLYPGNAGGGTVNLNLNLTSLPQIPDQVYGRLYKIVVDLNANLDTATATDIANQLENMQLPNNCAGVTPEGCILSILDQVEDNIENVVNTYNPIIRSRLLIPPPSSEMAKNTLFSFDVGKPADTFEVYVKIDVRKTLTDKLSLNRNVFRTVKLDVTLKITPQL